MKHLYTCTTTFIFLAFLATACTSGLSDAFKNKGNTGLNADSEESHVSKTHTSVDYRSEMVSLVAEIADYAHTKNSSFYIIPQNGEELIFDEKGALNQDYLNAIDGLAREDLFYGYNKDNQATPRDEQIYMQSFFDEAQKEGKPIFTIDYCWSPKKVERSFTQNYNKGYVPFVAPNRELDIIPDYDHSLYQENSLDVNTLAEVKNFLYLINPQNYDTKEALLQDIERTNHDLIVIDLFLYDDISFTADEIERLKTKANGRKRLVLAYMSVGEAEDYRYYWEAEWSETPPSWMEPENPDWPGNFKVEYWNQQWQDLLMGTSESYLDRILDAGFDGTYLDLIDAYYYFETQK